jgi:transcriptional regulator with GAF, ATPase, and Fis domain
MMMREVPVLEDTGLIINLAEMISEVDIEKQFAKIAGLLKEHFPVQGILLSLQETNTRKPCLHTENMPRDISKQIHEFLRKQRQQKGPRGEILAFLLKEGEMLSFDVQKLPDSEEPAVLAVPLSAGNRVFGTLALVADLKTIPNLTGGKSTPLLLTPIISGLLHNTISRQENAEKIRFLRLYQTVSSALGYVGDLHELLTTIISIVISELPSQEGSVLLYDEETNEFEFFTAVGKIGSELVKIRFPADKGIAGRALKDRETLVVNDVQNSPDFYGSFDEEYGFKTESILATPIISGDEVIGVIEAINKIGKRGFDEDDKRVLAAIADEVALAIKNARLFDYVVASYCKIRQGQLSCKGCKRPLKSWTPCAIQIGKTQ